MNRAFPDNANRPGAVVWFTGLSGSGKSTLAEALELKLRERGIPAARLDGDELREGLNRDLGFSLKDRTENVRRVGEVARLFARHGLVALCPLISPLRRDRDTARQACLQWNLPFVEVYVAAPVAACETRDPKGLWARARRGEIQEFTGISSPYEPPLSPDVTLQTHQQPLDLCVEALLSSLLAKLETHGG